MSEMKAISHWKITVIFFFLIEIIDKNQNFRISIQNTISRWKQNILTVIFEWNNEWNESYFRLKNHSYFLFSHRNNWQQPKISNFHSKWNFSMKTTHSNCAFQVEQWVKWTLFHTEKAQLISLFSSK